MMFFEQLSIFTFKYIVFNLVVNKLFIPLANLKTKKSMKLKIQSHFRQTVALFFFLESVICLTPSNELNSTHKFIKSPTTKFKFVRNHIFFLKKAHGLNIFTRTSNLIISYWRPQISLNLN